MVLQYTFNSVFERNNATFPTALLGTAAAAADF